METKNNDIDELFQNSFENFEVEPPSEIKALIDKQLQFTSKRRFGGLWYLAIIGIILAVSTLVYFSLSKTGSQKRTELAGNNSAQKQIDTFSSKNEVINKNKRNLSPTYPIDSSFNSSEEISVDKEQKNILEKNQLEKNLQKLSSKLNGERSNKKSTSKSSNTVNHNTNKTPKNQTSNNKKNRIKNSQKLKEKLIAGNSLSDNGKENQENNVIETTNKNKLETENVKKDEAQIGTYESNKKDSTNTSLATKDVKDSIQTKDSSLVTNQNPDKKNPDKISPFLFAFKTDYLIPTGKQSENDIKFSTNNAFYFQVEATYLVRSSVGFNSGVNYFSSFQTFFKTTTSTDSTFTGYTYQPIYDDSMAYIFDSNQMIIDSVLVTFVIDSISTANYDVKNVNSTQSSNFTVSSFSLPLIFYYNQKLGSNLSLDLMVGGILSFQQIKFRDASNPLNNDLSINKFGVKAILKTSLRYQFKHFGVSLNNNFLYDLKPMQYQGTKARKMSYGIGIGVFWRI